MLPRKPYTGLDRKLVLALDIGTTASGISYVLLEPGKIPEVRGVTRFPAQERVGGDSKIPSVLFYDSAGTPRAMGAETLKESTIEQAEDENWTKIEWFKLHLRPKGLDTAHMKDLPLPPKKTIVGVYADFLAYLLLCTKSYIEDTHGNGQSLWESVEDDIEYVVTHPNGWEGPQQAQLRRALVEARFIPDTTDGQKRVQFLTEGEASLHFCVHSGLGSDITDKPGQGIIIVDAGGGTIDTSAFAAVKTRSFEEISIPQCHFQGSVFVTKRAKDFLQEKFLKTNFASDVSNMADIFDRTTKLRFRSAEEPAHIKFGRMRDKDVALGIRSGQLTLKGSDVAAFFKPSIDAMIQAILTQHKNSQKPISNVFLVGGFASSNFVFLALQTALKPLGITLSRPDGHVNKAVADGAASFYLDRLVSTRVARFDYGVMCSVPYSPFFAFLHPHSSHFISEDERGRPMVHGHFDPILPKGTQVSGEQTFSESYYRTSPNINGFEDQIDVTILIYRGNLDHPRWINMDIKNFSVHCRVTGNIGAVPKIMQRGPKGFHYEASFDVNIVFGPAEMTAYVSWEENGVQKRGPAQVIYDEGDDDE